MENQKSQTYTKCLASAREESVDAGRKPRKRSTASSNAYPRQLSPHSQCPFKQFDLPYSWLIVIDKPMPSQPICVELDVELHGELCVLYFE
jgi:hypothetical protein